MEGATTISQQLSMVNNLDLQSIHVHDTKYVSFHFEGSGQKFHEDIKEKP